MTVPMTYLLGRLSQPRTVSYVCLPPRRKNRGLGLQITLSGHACIYLFIEPGHVPVVGVRAGF